MKLEDYLENTKGRNESKNARLLRFAALMGVSIHTVYKWLNGQRGIKDDKKLEIVRISRGRVTIKDLMR